MNELKFNGREIKWRGAGPYLFSENHQAWVKCSKVMIPKYEADGLKVIFIKRNQLTKTKGS